MVKTTISTVDPNHFKGVHASRGKIPRAEPIAALAEHFKSISLAPFQSSRTSFVALRRVFLALRSAWTRWFGRSLS